MLSSELQTFLPIEVSDANTNGGMMSANQVVSGVVQNVWDHVPKAERLAGSRKYRGLFDKVGNDDDESLLNPGYYLDGDTLGEDWAFFFPSGQRETQIDWTANNPPSQKYVAGTLLAAVTSTDTALTIVFKDNEQAVVVPDGALLRVSDKTDPDQVAGNETFLTVSGTPSVSDKQTTVSFGSTQIGYNFAEDVTKISMVYEPGTDITTVVDNVVVTSAGGGEVDTDQMTMDNIGTVEQTFTFAFNSATAFTVTGNTLTGLPAGDTTTTYSPLNSDWAKPLFNLPPAFWLNTFANGDTVVLQTHPAAQPLVQERRVPANCASLANNRIRKVTIGESVS